MSSVRIPSARLSRRALMGAGLARAAPVDGAAERPARV